MSISLPFDQRSVETYDSSAHASIIKLTRAFIYGFMHSIRLQSSVLAHFFLRDPPLTRTNATALGCTFGLYIVVNFNGVHMKMRVLYMMICM